MKIDREYLLKGSEDLTIEGTSLSAPSVDLLVIKDDNNITEHLNMHPVGHLRYTLLYDMAKAELDEVKRQYDLWKSQTYRIVSQELSSKKVGGRAPTIADINAEIDITYEKEIAKWQKKIDEVASMVDILKAYLNAWIVKKETLLELARLQRWSMESEIVVNKKKLYNGSSSYEEKLKETEELLKGGKNE